MRRGWTATRRHCISLNLVDGQSPDLPYLYPSVSARMSYLDIQATPQGYSTNFVGKTVVKFLEDRTPIETCVM
jgi:hypothetical protein